MRYPDTKKSLHNPFSDANQADGVKLLLVACAITIGLYFVPYAGLVTYPIRLLVTFIHEGSHALMSLLTGGAVQSISIQPDGSGLTMSMLRGWVPSLLVSSAGYLGASLYGAGMIGLLKRGIPGRTLLLITAGAVGLVTLGVFLGLPFTLNVFGLFWGIVITGLLLLFGLKMPREMADWVAAFIGVQCVLNAFFDLKTLFNLSVSTGAATDAMSMFRLTLLPAPFWAVLWMAMSAIMLLIVLQPNKRLARIRVQR